MNKKVNWYKLLGVIVCLCCWSCQRLEPVVTNYRVIESFEVVNVGLDMTSKPVYGLAWVDINNDDYPDLWMNNHADTSQLFINRQGFFVDSTSRFLTNPDVGDKHGVMWADLDNDGDQDLVQLRGASFGTSSDPNSLLINYGGILYDSALAYKIDYPLARGRVPALFDFNNDNYLDLFLGAHPRSDNKGSSALFLREAHAYKLTNSLPTALAFIPIDLIGDKKPEFLSNEALFNHNFDKRIQNIPPHRDVAFADINNDLLTDLILATDERGTDVRQVNDTEIDLNVTYKSKFELSFVSDADLSVITNTRLLTRQDIKLYNGNKLIENPQNEIQLFRSAGNSRATSANGFYFSFNPNNKRWNIKGKTKQSVWNCRLLIKSGRKITHLTYYSDKLSEPLNDRILLNNHDRLRFHAKQRMEPTSGTAVISGDFDNDMDVDFIIFSSTHLSNQQDLFYENTGNGLFNIAQLDSSISFQKGVKKSAAAADYNLDGFLDFIMASENKKTRYPGPSYTLVRNKPNDNNWIQIDLEGTLSNRDGIGAKVIIDTQGKKQLRQQMGGIHYNTQDFKRIHFGLGQNEIIDKITVEWPSGITQNIVNIEVNQILRITESEN